VGVAGGVGWGTLFRHGKPVRRVAEAELLPALVEEIEAVLAERGAAGMRRG